MRVVSEWWSLAEGTVRPLGVVVVDVVGDEPVVLAAEHAELVA